MNHLFTIQLLLGLFSPTCISNSQVKEESTTIKVLIPNFKNNNGHVLVSLFKSEEGFPDNPMKAFRSKEAVIIKKQSTLEFNDLPDGRYAIAVLHDENDDRIMNKNWLGLPKESYGFSNNVMGTFGPPSFDRASFTVIKGKTTVITVRLKG